MWKSNGNRDLYYKYNDAPEEECYSEYYCKTLHMEGMEVTVRNIWK